MSSMYIKLGNDIQGPVTDKNHSDWSEIYSYNLDVQRPMKVRVGHTSDRHGTEPNLSTLEITKETDQTSPKLLQHVCNAKVIPEVILDVCDTNNENYVQYTLSDVMICGVDSTGSAGVLVESVSLSYTKIAMTYRPRDKHNLNQAPISSEFNLETAEVG